MGANRDAANDVYTALHFTRVVTSTPESVPAAPTDGESCIGYNVVFLSTKLLAGATSHSYELYFYDGVAWKLVEDSSTLAVADFDPTKDFEQHYNVAAVQRFAVRLMTNVGGDVRVTTNVSV
jgi:hypothetical protein